MEDMLKVVASKLEQMQYPDNQIGAIQQQMILAQGQLRGDVGPERRSEEAERQMWRKRLAESVDSSCHLIVFNVIPVVVIP